jgi:hypothetical protein
LSKKECVLNRKSNFVSGDKVEFCWNQYWYYAEVIDYDKNRDLYCIQYRDMDVEAGVVKIDSDVKGGVVKIDRDVPSYKVRRLSIFYEDEKVEVSYYGLWYRVIAKDYLHQKGLAWDGVTDGPHIVYIDYPSFQEWNVDLFRLRIANHQKSV